MKNVTLRDVAELAGVSQTTASLTLNHSSRANFRNGTRKRVLAAARQLGYRSSASLKRRTDITEYMLLVLVPTLAKPYKPAVRAFCVISATSSILCGRNRCAQSSRSL